MNETVLQYAAVIASVGAGLALVSLIYRVIRYIIKWP
jgi:hypothetical protein